MTINGVEYKYGQSFIVADEYIPSHGSVEAEILVDQKHKKDGEYKKSQQMQLPFSLDKNKPVQIYTLTKGFVENPQLTSSK